VCTCIALTAYLTIIPDRILINPTAKSCLHPDGAYPCFRQGCVLTNTPCGQSCPVQVFEKTFEIVIFSSKRSVCCLADRHVVDEVGRVYDHRRFRSRSCAGVKQEFPVWIFRSGLVWISPSVDAPSSVVDFSRLWFFLLRVVSADPPRDAKMSRGVYFQ